MIFILIYSEKEIFGWLKKKIMAMKIEDIKIVKQQLISMILLHKSLKKLNIINITGLSLVPSTK